MAAKKRPKVSFEEGMAALEERIAAINGGALSLEETMKVYEEGVALVRLCSTRLEDAERKVKILTESHN